MSFIKTINALTTKSNKKTNEENNLQDIFLFYLLLIIDFFAIFIGFKNVLLLHKLTFLPEILSK